MGMFGEEKYALWIRCVLMLLQFWNWLYNILSYIPFLILENPPARVENSKRIKAKPLFENEECVAYRNVDSFDHLLTKEFDDVDTIDRLWERSVMSFTKNPCMGVREVLSVEREKQPNGKIYEKMNLGKYIWYSYEEVDEMVQHISSGLITFGHKPGVNLIIFAETQAKWMITALACVKDRIPVVTVYSTLGEAAIIRAVNQTQSETVVTSEHLLPKVAKILSKCSSIRRLVYFESEKGFFDRSSIEQLTRLPFISFAELLKMGESKGKIVEKRYAADSDGLACCSACCSIA
ncbi:unnamed protein product [Soboliphyme baturini]|uniref:long-chain-fatty-acid--CoA ligase n=1 Tax=Soboliphyme baturini TaxID=241478 RepID=A0A183IXF9_9BILA|nr:unnamed protein product [Soboliphyme baturini]